MQLRVFLATAPPHRWVRLPEDPPSWYPAPVALPRIPLTYRERDVQVAHNPAATAGQLRLPGLEVSDAWRTGPPASPSMAVRWRTWLRDNRG